MKHLGDITKINWFEVEPVDVVTGGSPCQDLSVAGKRAGLAGERSGLFMEQIRCVKELRQADVQRGRTGQFIRPRFMVWENVPGAFSSGNPKGADFAAVIEEIIKVAEPGAVVHVRVPDRGWTKSGCYYAEDGSWSIAWRVHDAQFWGVPQRRKRISLVADFGGLSAPEVSFERKGLRWDFEKSKAQGEGVAGAIAQGACRSEPVVYNGENSTSPLNKTDVKPGDPCHTLGMDTRNYVAGVNCKTMTIDGDIVSTITTEGRTAGGSNPLVAAFSAGQGEKAGGIGWKEECSPSLKAAASGTNMTPTVLLTYQNVTGPLMANSHPGSYCGQDAYSDMLVTPFAAGGYGKYEEGVGTLSASGGGYGGGTETLAVSQTVRRLTPLECERLQGYPDGWTDIGEWVDTKGKKHKEADSPRYKALGNSIALPFWCWLAKRITAQYERDITMGSLFDGIGGFPYAFEKCGGKAVWASEIEEFPIAVTKLRFGED